MADAASTEVPTKVTAHSEDLDRKSSVEEEAAAPTEDLTSKSSELGRRTSEAGKPILNRAASPSDDAGSQHSNGTDTGGSEAGGDVKSRESTGKTTKVAKFRKRTWIMMLLSQLVLSALIISELSMLSSFISTSKKDLAKSNLHLLEEMYKSKLEEMGKIMEVMGENSQVQDLLIKHEDSNVNSELREMSSHMTFEYFALINTSNQVVASNIDSLVGTVFDPLSLASSMFASSTPETKSVTAVVPRQDLLLDEIVTWRETDIDGYSLLHPTDFESTSALVRYIAYPVKDQSSNLIATLIGGDIATGKHSVAEDTLSELGAGFVLILHKTDEGSWTLSQSVLGTGFGQFDAMFESVQESFYDEVSSKGETTFTKLNILVEQEKYVVAGQRLETVTGKAIMIVGFPQTKVDAMQVDLIISTALFAAACIIVDLMATFWSIRWFIDPLEKLVILVNTKNTKKIDDALQNIKTSKRFIYRIAIFSFASTALLTGMFINNSKLLDKIFKTEGALQTQVRFLQRSYSIKIEELVSDASSMCVSDNISKILTNPTQILINEVQNDLENLRIVFQIELAFLVDVNRTIVASAGGTNVNQEFNEFTEEFADVLRNGKGMQFTTSLSHSVYSSFAPPEWTFNGHHSALHPSQSSSNVVLRLVLSPVINSADGKTIIGVLVYGDILNGKGFEIPLKSVQFFNEGFAGVYSYDAELDSIQLLSSYTFHSDSFDLDISSRAALEQVKKMRETVLEKNIEIGENSEIPKHSIAVERVDPGLEFDVLSEYSRKSAKHDSLVFLVRGTEYAQFKSMEKSQLGLEISSIILNFVFSVGVAIYTFVPVYKFSMNMKMKMSAKKRTTLGSVADMGGSLFSLEGAKNKITSAMKSLSNRSTKDSSVRDSINQ